jgi:hypothetical protein
VTRSARTAARPVLAAALCALAAAPAAGEVLPWDPARVTGLARELGAATNELYDTFFKQPRPPTTPSSTRDYHRLKADLRRLQNEARGFLADLESGEGREETRPAFESMLVTVNWARERAQSVFTTKDVQEKASRVRAILNQLAPLYDPDAVVPR